MAAQVIADHFHLSDNLFLQGSAELGEDGVLDFAGVYVRVVNLAQARLGVPFIPRYRGTMPKQPVCMQSSLVI